MSWRPWRLRALEVIRESYGAARSQPVASTLTILMVAGMIVTVMLTTGRTVAAEQSVLNSIDSVGTRSITIRADDGAGLRADALQRIARIDGVEWSAAFSAAVDSTNSAVPAGNRLPVRFAYGSQLDRLGVPQHQPFPDHAAYASEGALEKLGLVDVAGAVTLTTGEQYAVVGSIVTPDFLVPFEPLVLIPRAAGSDADVVNVIVVIAERPELVASVSDVVQSLLAPDDPTLVTVQTSETLAALRSLVQNQLGSFSRGLVIIVLGITGSLVGAILYGLVILRRKDFGRRRALGATRSLIVQLLLCQTAILAAAGTLIGSACSVVALIVTGSPLPGIQFTLAVGVLAVATAITAALTPALVASRREPIRELRVP